MSGFNISREIRDQRALERRVDLAGREQERLEQELQREQEFEAIAEKVQSIFKELGRTSVMGTGIAIVNFARRSTLGDWINRHERIFNIMTNEYSPGDGGLDPYPVASRYTLLEETDVAAFFKVKLAPDYSPTTMGISHRNKLISDVLTGVDKYKKPHHTLPYVDERTAEVFSKNHVRNIALQWVQLEDITNVWELRDINKSLEETTSEVEV